MSELAKILPLPFKHVIVINSFVCSVTIEKHEVIELTVKNNNGANIDSVITLNPTKDLKPGNYIQTLPLLISSRLITLVTDYCVDLSCIVPLAFSKTIHDEVSYTILTAANLGYEIIGHRSATFTIPLNMKLMGRGLIVWAGTEVSAVMNVYQRGPDGKPSTDKASCTFARNAVIALQKGYLPEAEKVSDLSLKLVTKNDNTSVVQSIQNARSAFHTIFAEMLIEVDRRITIKSTVNEAFFYGHTALTYITNAIKQESPDKEALGDFHFEELHPEQLPAAFAKHELASAERSRMNMIVAARNQGQKLLNESRSRGDARSVLKEKSKDVIKEENQKDMLEAHEACNTLIEEATAEGNDLVARVKERQRAQQPDATADKSKKEPRAGRKAVPKKAGNKGKITKN